MVEIGDMVFAFERSAPMSDITNKRSHHCRDTHFSVRLDNIIFSGAPAFLQYIKYLGKFNGEMVAMLKCCNICFQLRGDVAKVAEVYYERARKVWAGEEFV